MNILISSMLTIDVSDLISAVQCTSSLLHGLHLSRCLIRPRKQGLFQGAWQHLHETVRVCVAVDAAAMPLPPAQHNQVVLPVAFVHQVPGIPVNTSVKFVGYHNAISTCEWEDCKRVVIPIEAFVTTSSHVQDCHHVPLGVGLGLNHYLSLWWQSCITLWPGSRSFIGSQLHLIIWLSSSDHLITTV